MTVNNLSSGEGTVHINYPLQALNAAPAKGQESAVNRIASILLSAADYVQLNGKVRYLGVTDRFRDVIETFHPADGEIPAGFRIESTLEDLIIKINRNVCKETAETEEKAGGCND